MSGLDPRACRGVVEQIEALHSFGKVSKVVGLVAEGSGLDAPLGAVCHILPESGKSIAAEVVGFRDGKVLFMPYGDMRGVKPGSLIRNSSLPPVFPAGPQLLGRTLDAFGNPLDGGPPLGSRQADPLPVLAMQGNFVVPTTVASDLTHKGRVPAWREGTSPLYADPPSPLQRPRKIGRAHV